MDLSALNFAKRLIQIEMQNHKYDFVDKYDWEKYRDDLISYLHKVIDTGKIKYKDSISHGTYKLDDMYIEYMDIYFNNDFYIPALIYKSVPTSYEGDIIIYLPESDRRKNDNRVVKTAVELSKKGNTVIVVDPAAQGETADRPDYTTDINNVNALSILLGTNLTTLEYLRLCSVLNVICSGMGSKNYRVSVRSEGSNGFVALIFALFNNKISSCHISDGILSIYGIIRCFPDKTEQLYFPKGLLKHADICHIAAALAPGKMFFEGKTENESFRFEKFMKKIYRLYNAEENLKFEWR